MPLLSATHFPFGLDAQQFQCDHHGIRTITITITIAIAITIIKATKLDTMFTMKDYEGRKDEIDHNDGHDQENDI